MAGWPRPAWTSSVSNPYRRTTRCWTWTTSCSPRTSPGTRSTPCGVIWSKPSPTAAGCGTASGWPMWSTDPPVIRLGVELPQAPGNPQGRRPMPIAINPEHQDLADSVRSLVARVAPSDVLHAALETPIDNPPPYWRPAADQGLQGVHLAESVGGQGFGILELAVVLAEFGYGAVPGPFVPSAIASALISAHDPDAKVLADLASGAAIAAYALESGLTATRQGPNDQALVIRGEVRAVPAAAQASVLVLPVAIDSGDEWVVLRADQLEIEPVKSLDPLRPIAHVRANAVEVGDDAALSNLTMTTAHSLMSTLLSAEAVGVA